MKKSQKQKTPNTIKQENQNKENPSQTFNTQLNFLMENELNAIGKLPINLHFLYLFLLILRNSLKIEAIVIKLRDKPLIFIYLRSFLLI
ncbi:hypothetical protein BSO36_06490 [Campylobacter coli]|nr:hypothetical protein [Campylobacter coli]